MESEKERERTSETRHAHYISCNSLRHMLRQQLCKMHLVMVCTLEFLIKKVYDLS